MSRSNPNENGNPNPAVRWFEWNGENGVIRYYDKDAKKNVEVGADMTFMLLDQLGSVRGWHDASSSGIYSNEVKDTTQDVMVVKAFKGGTLAEGIYRDIKDRIKSQGGQFVANCYIAFKHDGELAIGSLRFKGAALGAWMEFSKEHRADLYKKAIRLHGSTTGKKGRITFHVPALSVAEISEQTNEAATALDEELQAFLEGYLAKNRRDQADHAGRHLRDEDVDTDHDDSADRESGYQHDTPPNAMSGITDDDIPF